MILSKLLNGIDIEFLQGHESININKIEYDSRKVQKNDVFVCIKGFSTDGHNYVNSAIEKGASVIVCEKNLKVPEEITVIKVEDSRKALALLAANYYDNPTDKLKVIGITGTNGKTTTSYMIKAILEEAGFKVGLVGTICNYIGSKKFHTERTTPESLELQELFHQMVEEKVQYCVMEVSSHSLDLDRVYGINFKSGIFTNLTRDHLDFHKTFENYFNAKCKLFNNSLVTITNLDDDYGNKVSGMFNSKKLTYAIDNSADVKAYDVKMQSGAVEYTLSANGATTDIKIFIPGRYNVYNSLSAAAAALNEGIELQIIKKALEKVQVPGRCELATKDFNLDYDIIIDYAHSPDGLENILNTAREFTKGRLICVFGCGGNRDKTKRPIMGSIGTRLSDIAIITSDNPRDEEPLEIINDIIQGVESKEYIVIENRKDAIAKAIGLAAKGDVIVIAGKGHEDYQILKNNEVIHFDEREIIREILGCS